MAISFETAYLWIIWLNRESVCKTLSPVTTVSFVLSSFSATRMDDLRLSLSSRTFCVRDTRRYVFFALSHTRVTRTRPRATAVIRGLIKRFVRYVPESQSRFRLIARNRSSEIREPSKQDVRDFGESAIFGIADHVQIHSSRGWKRTLISLNK